MTFTVAACLKNSLYMQILQCLLLHGTLAYQIYADMLVLIPRILRKVFLICLWSFIWTTVFNCYAFSQVRGFCRNMTVIFKNLEQRYLGQHSPLSSRLVLLHNLGGHLSLLIGNTDHSELLFPYSESFVPLAKTFPPCKNEFFKSQINLSLVQGHICA